jgi:TonB family protein
LAADSKKGGIMTTLEDEPLTDYELSELLSVWSVPEPPPALRTRIFVPRTALFTGPWRTSAAVLLAQVAAAAILVQIAGTRVMHKPVSDTVFEPVFFPHLERPSGKAQGGGGNRATLPARKGEAPRQAPNQFIPPAIVIAAQPKLPTSPSITAAAPTLQSENYGDPLSNMLNGGLGAGKGTGLGSGSGDGYGPGTGGGTGGGVFRIGRDVSAPVLVSKVEPEYSEEARKAKYSGTVLLSLIIDERGLPRDIKVVRPLGLGLDEKAIEAVRKWRFRPALKAGQPVAVSASVEVAFRLL